MLTPTVPAVSKWESRVGRTDTKVAAQSPVCLPRENRS